MISDGNFTWSISEGYTCDIHGAARVKSLCNITRDNQPRRDKVRRDGPVLSA